MDNVSIFGQDQVEAMVFALRIQSMWARPCGGHGVCVND